MIKRKCFIVTPIGAENSEIRRHIDGIIDAVIKPVVHDLDFDSYVAHEISTPGSITRQVMEHVINDELVIVNLTNQNPNVMYELGVRHATAKPVVYICCKDTTPSLPFDIAEQRTIFYKNDFQGTLELQENLEKCINEINFSQMYTDNPVFKAVKNFKMTELNSSELPADKVELLFSSIIDIKDEIEELKSGRISVSSSNIPRQHVSYRTTYRIKLGIEERDFDISPRMLVQFNGSLMDVCNDR